MADSTEETDPSETEEVKYADSYGGGAGRFLFVKRLWIAHDRDLYSRDDSDSDVGLSLSDLEWAVERAARRAYLPRLPTDAELDAAASGSSQSKIPRLCAWPFLDSLGEGATGVPTWDFSGESRGATPDSVANGWDSTWTSLAGLRGFVGIDRSHDVTAPDGGECRPATWDDLAQLLVDDAFGASSHDGLPLGDGCSWGGSSCFASRGRAGFVVPDDAGLSKLGSWTTGAFSATIEASAPPDADGIGDWTPYGWDGVAPPGRVFPADPPFRPLAASFHFHKDEDRGGVKAEFPSGAGGRTVVRTTSLPSWAKASAILSKVPFSATVAPSGSSPSLVGDDPHGGSVVLGWDPSPFDSLFPATAVRPGAPLMSEAYGGSVGEDRMDEACESAWSGRLAFPVPGSGVSYSSGGATVSEAYPPPAGPTLLVHGDETWWWFSGLEGLLASVRGSALCESLCVPPCLPGELPYSRFRDPDVACVPSGDGWAEDPDWLSAYGSSFLGTRHARPALPPVQWVRGLGALMSHLMTRTYYVVDRMYVKARMTFGYSGKIVSWSGEGEDPEEGDEGVGGEPATASGTVDYEGVLAPGGGEGALLSERYGYGRFSVPATSGSIGKYDGPVPGKDDSPFRISYVQAAGFVSESVKTVSRRSTGDDSDDDSVSYTQRKNVVSGRTAGLKFLRVEFAPAGSSVGARVKYSMKGSEYRNNGVATSVGTGSGEKETGSGEKETEYVLKGEFGSVVPPAGPLFAPRVRQFVKSVRAYGVFEAHGTLREGVSDVTTTTTTRITPDEPTTTSTEHSGGGSRKSCTRADAGVFVRSLGDVSFDEEDGRLVAAGFPDLFAMSGEVLGSTGAGDAFQKAAAGLWLSSSTVSSFVATSDGEAYVSKDTIGITEDRCALVGWSFRMVSAFLVVDWDFDHAI